MACPITTIVDRVDLDADQARYIVAGELAARFAGAVIEVALVAGQQIVAAPHLVATRVN